MNSSSAHQNDFLPEPLSDEPFTLFGQWFTAAHALKAQPNPNAMVLATVNAAGHPDARIVLCKHWSAEPGHIVFYTNYQSRKGEQLTAYPQAAVVFHWDVMHRQVRMTGPVVKSPPDESDAYFNIRPLGNRIGAWASKQSQPLASRAQLATQVREMEQRFGDVVPRPPHWGGFRLWPETVELWVEGPGRVHDRAVWTRKVTPRDAYTFDCTAWSATRLNP
jgi:pyridoxamine 5'-phosphate oxidase